MTRPTDPRGTYEVFRGTYRGLPAEIVAQPLKSFGVEVVAYLNPDGGIPTGHHTSIMSALEWESIKRRLALQEINA